MSDRAIEVIPSLPASSFDELKEKVALVHEAVDTFQIDIADGLFVPNRSWPMNAQDKAQFARLVSGDEKLPHHDTLNYEVHFMAHNPEKLLNDWIKVGIVRALFHAESQHDFAALRDIAGDSIELGVSLKVGTPVSRIERYLPHISVVQVMGIAGIGVQGQPFDQRAISMIQELRTHYQEIPVEVDGSVNAETATQLVHAGATRLAPGSYVFRAENPHNAVATLKATPLR